MTVDELKIARTELENRIRDELVAFSRRTGASVIAVHVGTVDNRQISQPDGAQIISSVSLDISL